MKVRLGFVTNSSSSSFLIAKKNLTPNQIKAIWQHIELGKKLNIKWADEDSRWNIYESEHFISGLTSMDNFSFADFFETIGVNDLYVIWNSNKFAEDAETKFVEMESDCTEKQTEWEDLLDEI